MRLFRSILAVVASFLLVFALSAGTDALLEAAGIFPSAAQQMKTGLIWWVLVIALAYRVVYTILGGTLAARLAPQRPMLHAGILGAVGTAAALAGTIVMWNLGSQWYPILLTVTALPSTWLGGWLARKKSV